MGGPKPVADPVLHFMEWDLTRELATIYLVTVETNKLILLLQPLMRDISQKDILYVKCHVSLPH